jgi:hypothetical protein
MEAPCCLRPLRPYDLRHAYASLLIVAGKNPLYIARQMGHYSAGFTLDTYGHLMDGAPDGAAPCSPVQPEEWLKPSPGAAPGSVVQPDAARCVVPRAGFEPALPA